MTTSMAGSSYGPSYHNIGTSDMSTPDFTSSGGTTGSMASAWMDYFGLPNQKVQQNPYDQFSVETADYPSAYKGRNVYVQQILITFLERSKQQAIRVILPWTESIPSIEVEWDQWVFDDAMLGIEPEESTTRLVTSQYNRGRTRLKRHGLGAMFECGFLNTERGQTTYRHNILQIANAIITTMCFGVHLTILNVAWYNLPNLYRNAKFRDARTLDEAINRMKRSWMALHKDPRAFEILIDEAQERLKNNTGKGGNVYVSPAGTLKFSAYRPPGFFDAPITTANWEDAIRGFTIVESQSFPQGYGELPIDPHFTIRKIATHFTMTDQYTRHLAPDEMKSRYLDTIVYDEAKDDWTRIQYERGLQSTGMFEPLDGIGMSNPDARPGSLTKLGTKVTAKIGATNWHDWLIHDKAVLANVIKFLSTHERFQSFLDTFATSAKVNSLPMPTTAVAGTGDYFSSAPAKAPAKVGGVLHALEEKQQTPPIRKEAVEAAPEVAKRYAPALYKEATESVHDLALNLARHGYEQEQIAGIMMALQAGCAQLEDGYRKKALKPTKTHAGPEAIHTAISLLATLMYLQTNDEGFTGPKPMTVAGLICADIKATLASFGSGGYSGTEMAGVIERASIGAKVARSMVILYNEAILLRSGTRGALKTSSGLTTLVKDHIKALAGASMWDLTTTVPEERKVTQISAILSSMPITYHFIDWCLKHDMPMIIGLFCYRIALYEAATAVLMQGYGEAGYTFQGNSNVMMGTDSARKMISLHFTMYARPVILNARCITHIPNLAVRDYFGGNGTALWNALNETDHGNFQRGGGMESFQKDIICVPMLPGEQITTTYVDLTGHMNPNLVELSADEPEPESVPAMANIYAKYWGLEHSPDSPFDMPAVNLDGADEMRTTLSFQAHQWVFGGELGSRHPTTLNELNRPIVEQGHMGSNIYPGVGATRKRFATMHIRQMDYNRSAAAMPTMLAYN